MTRFTFLFCKQCVLSITWISVCLTCPTFIMNTLFYGWMFITNLASIIQLTLKLLIQTSQDVNNPVVKEILLSSNISKVACALVYCIVTPLLEETVYRGFLLTSLASTMNWQHAVFLSSAVFSAAHFSGENFVQLFIIGCVLGCCFSWTGNLTSSFLIHSLYNAVTLIITFMY